jgi:hypothetical protein
VSLDRSLRVRLTERSAERFTGDTLFDEVARTVCKAGVLPRKELYESWEFARRTRRHLRGGRVVDLACGHGLLGALMLLLDDKSPEALCVDARIPPSAQRVLDVLVARWPRLEGRVHLEERDLEEVELREGDLVVSAHACGPLTDTILARAIAANADVAVLPCCHPLAMPEAKAWPGWVDGALAIDVRRALRLEQAGYKVMTRTIPAEITPKNRLLLGSRRGSSPAPAGTR